MATKISFNEQEQHIVRNKNAWEDEILINNKNKADFTIHSQWPTKR